jgi:mono/diheme cytochrome c family protein
MGSKFGTVISIAFFIAASLTQLAYAGQSQIESGYLIVPRIDVEGHGAIELVFRIEFDGEYLFVLEQVNAASLSTDNSGLFDPVQLTLDIDELALGAGELYYLQLRLVSQFPYTIFNLAAAARLNPGAPQPDTAVGATLYDTQCASCHGEDGNGGSFPVSLTAELPRSELIDIISQTMPLGTAASCDEQCAADVADYILANLVGAGGAGAGDVASPFACNAPNNDPGPTALVRLTPSQYKNSARDLFGDSIDLEEFLPGGVSDQDVGKALADASQFDVENYASAAAELSQYVASNIDEYAPCSQAGQSTAARECASSFLQTFGTRIFRSSLESDEVDALLGVFDVGFEGNGYSQGIGLML